MFALILIFAAGNGIAVEANFLAYGDIRGYLEPCGCDPATDLGGIRRINSQLRRELLAAPSSLILNLGNNLSDRKDDAIKNSYLIRAEEENRPDAYLINIREILNMKNFSSYKIPFLLSNAKGKDLGKPLLKAKDAIFFGYTWTDSVADKVDRISDSMLKSWKKTIEREKSKDVVLLFSGLDSDLNLIVKAGLFTQIVSGNSRPLTEDPGKDEVLNESLLIRRSEPLIFMVPAGGQGILRGGDLTTGEAKTLDGYLKKDEKNCKADGMALPLNCSDNIGQLFGKKNVRVTWLKKETEPGHALGDLYEKYNQEVSSAFLAKAKERLLALKSSPYAGDASCAQCHQQQHTVYQETRHAKAMQTLIDKGKHEDPECVACHSLGSTSPGGFVSVADSPQFANVQCENCHGPRKDHIANPIHKAEKGKLGEAVCVTCHNRQHSSSFVFAKYWEKIKH